jgi:hypothetical protein
MGDLKKMITLEAKVNNHWFNDTKPAQNSKLRLSMITALIQFKLPKPLTRQQARETFLSTAPKYRDTPGLIRKYYLLSQDGGTAGGVSTYGNHVKTLNASTRTIGRPSFLKNMERSLPLPTLTARW